jgi:uncharacterized membrane protein YoaK (UPF0700 family)
MEDSEHDKRRWILYGVSVVYSGLAVLAGIACSQGINSGEFLEYIVPAGFAAISLMTFYAGRKGYRGGYWFIASTLLASLSVGFIYTSYDFYRKADTNTMAGGIILASLSMLLAALMFWQGNRRHLRISRGPDFDAVTTTIAVAEPATHYGETANDTPLLLYPPMQSWRVFLLMLLSSTFYSFFLMYRIARDLYELGEKQLNPKHCAWQLLIPLYNFTVFLTVAKHVTRQAKASGFTVKVSSGALMLMLILAYVGNFMLPDFLFLLSISLVTIPWMILNERMNQVRRCHAADWREPSQLL